MFKLEYVHPDRLRDWWDAICPGIEACKRRGNDDWIAEDVYHAIKSGGSHLHVITMGGDYAGFIVTTPDITEFTKERVLHVWLAFSSGDYDIWEPSITQLTQNAQNSGIKKVTCASPRRGFERKGFKVKHTIYEMDI